MESSRLEDSLKDALAGLQYYVDLQVKYNKLLFAKKTGEFTSYFITFLILLGIFSFALLFLSFAFVEWYAARYGDRLTGRLIVGVFYLVMGLVVFLFRKNLIKNPVRRFLGMMLSSETDEDGISAFKTKETLNKSIHKYKKAIKSQEKDLKDKFDKLGSDFSFPKIIQNAARATYQSFMTAKNMAKLSFYVMNGIKHKIGSIFFKKEKKKHPKKLKGKNSEED